MPLIPVDGKPAPTPWALDPLVGDLKSTQLPVVPLNTLCTVRGWAEETRTHQVSKLILGPGKGDAVSATSDAASTDSAPPLLRPIINLADLKGLASENLINGVLRQYDRAEYLAYLQRTDRPLILNWVEDFPKLVAAQCVLHRIPAPTTQVTRGALDEADFATTVKPLAANEFECRRLEEQFKQLETRRRAIFENQLQVGPAFDAKRPVVLSLPASLSGEYDFQNHRYALQTMMENGQVRLTDFLGVPCNTFDGCAVLYGEGRRWQTPYLPVDEATAERLRGENVQLLMVVEGYIWNPGRRVAMATGFATERAVFVKVSKVTFLALPKLKAPYLLSQFEVSPR